MKENKVFLQGLGIAFGLLMGIALLGVLVGAKIKHTTGGPSGRVHHGAETLTDKVATFSTSSFDMGESTKLIMTANFTEVGGGAPTVDCVIKSGESRTQTDGDTTGTSFTQKTATGIETKTIVDGKYHQYIWATCTMAGTITTVDVTFSVTGKP